MNWNQLWLCASLLAIISLSAPSNCAAEKLAITFDDLPLNGELAPGTTRTGIVTDVVAVLKGADGPPVYGFVNAGRFEDVPDGAAALKLWVQSGESIGNHTYSHPDLSDLSAPEFLADLRRNEPALELLDAGNGWKWFRYPYLHEGDTLNKHRAVRRALRERGYRIAEVTIDYEDYLYNTPYARCLARGDRAAIEWLRSSYLALARGYIDADRQMAQMIYGRSIDHVLLLHLGAFSSAILPDLLQLLKDEGFTLVTLEQAQADPAYELDPDAGSKHGGTLLEQALDARHLPYPPAPKKPYRQLERICQ